MNSSHANLHDLRRSGGAGDAVTVPAPRSRWKTRILLPAVILATIGLLLLITSLQTLLPATPVRVVPVVVKSVEGASGSVTVQAPGWLEPDPFPTYVTALTDGIVEDVLVLEGARVAAGDVVARLVDEDAQLAMRRAEALLRQRQAELAAAEAELTAMREVMDTLVDRTRNVEVSAAAAAQAQAELEKVEADIAVERAKLAELNDEYERKVTLVDSQAVSAATVARLKLRVEAQQATVDAVVARRSIAESQVKQAQVEHAAARQHIELLIEEKRALALAEADVANARSAVQLAEADRDIAALQLERTQVRSPISGVVLRRLVSPGSKVTRDGAEHAPHVVHLYDPEKLQVRVDVPLAEASHVSVGQPAEVTVEVLPDRVFDGVVARIVHEADIQKNTVEVKVAITNPSSVLKPEMLARVRFLATQTTADGNVRQRVFAPRALVQSGGEGSSTLIVSSLQQQRGRADRRSITVGRRVIDGWVEIESGLNAGDLLIAEPPVGLEDGDRVRVIGEATAVGDV